MKKIQKTYELLNKDDFKYLDHQFDNNLKGFILMNI